MTDEIRYSLDTTSGAKPAGPEESARQAQEPQTPEQPATKLGTGEKQPGLPEKFNTVEDLVSSYNELQAAYTKATQGKADPKPQDPTEISPDLSMYLSQAADEYDRTGQISTKIVSALEKFGITRDLQERFIAGVNAQASMQMEKIYSSIGGVEEWKRLHAWAEQNLSTQEKYAFNEMVSRSPEQAILAAQGLYARMGGRLNSNPELVKGRTFGSNPAVEGPMSLQEQLRLQASPEYRAMDPEVHAKVDRGILARIKAQKQGLM